MKMSFLLPERVFMTMEKAEDYKKLLHWIKTVDTDMNTQE